MRAKYDIAHNDAKVPGDHADVSLLQWTLQRNLQRDNATASPNK
jgi:hypothetical protein